MRSIAGPAAEHIAASRGCTLTLPISASTGATRTPCWRARADRLRAAAEERGYWLACQHAGAFLQLHDDRVLVECGPDQAVRERHFGARVLAHEELGRTAPNPVARAGVGVPGHVRRHQQHRDLLLGQLIGDGPDAANRGRVWLLGARRDQVTDSADGRGGDLVEGGVDRGAEAVVEATGLAAAAMVVTGPSDSGR